jgi:hypothetical protein
LTGNHVEQVLIDARTVHFAPISLLLFFLFFFFLFFFESHTCDCSEEDSYETYLEWKRCRSKDPRVKARVGGGLAKAPVQETARVAAAPPAQQQVVESSPFEALAKRVDEDARKAGVALDEEPVAPPQAEEKKVEEPKAAEPVTQKVSIIVNGLVNASL